MRIISESVRISTGLVLALLPSLALAQHYTQTNLVSDLATFNGAPVAVQDPNLKNAWGLARGAASPWWVNNNGTGTSTLYTGAGATVALVVTVPNAKGVTTHSNPTGMVFNGTTDFDIAPGNPAMFIFATSNGTISGWGPPATPVTTAGKSVALNEVDESKEGAVFLGLTWVESEGNHFLLAANFSENRIEMFDKNFKRVNLSDDAFADDHVPRDFAPYNVQAVGATVVVSDANKNAP